MKNIDTNDFFVGGNGMFIEYHDVIRPVYFYVLMKLIIDENAYGIPVDIISEMSLPSLIEWYKSRRYINPIIQLDIDQKYSKEMLDKILDEILANDVSLYKLAPLLNIGRIFSVYRSQNFSFPIYIYSEKYEEGIDIDCENVLKSVNPRYVYGDLKTCISENCDQNFTYIFSDIDKMKSSAEILLGTYSHILLSSDYRYNYKDAFKTYKYDLEDMMYKHPIIRTGTITSFDLDLIAGSFDNVMDVDEYDDEDEED